MADEEFNPGLVANIAAGITLTDDEKRIGLTPEKMALAVLRLRQRPDLVAKLDAIVDERYAAQKRDDPFMAELREAAAGEQLNEALAALHRATTAAGIADTERGSIAEIGDLLAARWAERREELAARPTLGQVNLLNGRIGGLEDANADLTASKNRLAAAVRRVRDLCSSGKQFDAGGMAVWVHDVLAALDGTGG